MQSKSLFRPLYFLWCFLLILNSFSPLIGKIEIPTASAEEANSVQESPPATVDNGEAATIENPAPVSDSESEKNTNPDLSPYVMPLLGVGIMGGGITYKLEGLIFGENPALASSWTTGNVCQGGGGCYTEGDNVPSRLTITGLTALTSYSTIIEHDYSDGINLGYLNFNRTGTILPDDNATGVTINYISPDVACSAGNICKDYDLSFLAGGDTAVIYWNSLLSLDAADWNGASLHFRLVEGVEGEKVGNKEVPIQVNQILYLPSLTLTKVVDSGSATPDEWFFNVSPAINGQSQFNIPTGENSVIIPNVPNGDYVVTEDGGAANYQFNGDGPNTNCKFSGSTATASVSSGDPANDGVCTFHNILSEGTIIVHKDVQGPTGQPVSDPSPEFVVNLDNADPESIYDGGTVTYNNVPTGAHTVKEITIPSGYDLYSMTPDGDANPLNGAQFNLASDQTVEIWIVNRQKNAQIIVSKDVLAPDGGPIDDNHQFSVELQGIIKKIAEGTDAIYTLAPGTYTLDEIIDPNYDLVGYSPDEDMGTSGAQITVLPGETKEILVTNKQKEARINVIKDVRAPNGDDVSDNHDFFVRLNGQDEELINESTQAHYGVNPGSGFSITEIDDANYEELGCRLPTGALADNFSLSSNEEIDITCTNKQQNAKVIIKKNVTYPDGTDIEDNSAFTVERDGGDAKIFSEETDAEYLIAPGDYTFTENSKTGYILHLIDPDNNADPADGTDVTLSSGEEITITFTNYRLVGSLIIKKDVVPDDSSQWEFDVSGPISDSDILSDGGTSKTMVLPTGSYSIVEKGYNGTKTDDYSSEYSCQNQYLDFVADGQGTEISGLNIESEEIVVCTFVNAIKKGKVIVTKFEDSNLNGNQDQGELPLPGWDINLSGDTKTTGIVDGQVIYDNLLPGDYELSETQKDGWQLTDIYCDNELEITSIAKIINPDSHNLKVHPDETVNCYIGNYYAYPNLVIEKTNNKLGIGLLAGDSVEYIITVRAENNFVDDVFVKDTLPIGFSFRDGSYNVGSSTKGDITGTIVAPSYDSMAATWNLGKIDKDEIITISYIADISGSQEPGVYPDNAWTEGKDYFGDVLGLAGIQGKVDTNFVGTEVKVIVQEGITSYNTEQKVRALPTTGPSAILIVIGGAFLFLLYTFFASRRKRKGMKIIASIVLILVLTSFYLVSYASAASINVRLESPKTPTSESNFKINFVAQDLQQRSGFAAKCYKQGPADVSFNQFGSDINFNGGISSFCDLDSSPLTVEGAYNFKVEITGAEAAESNIVSVQFIAGVPGTPTNYLKTQNGCNYTIEFRTADDGGKTVRAEIYMSSSKSFIVGPETMIKNIIVGSSQNVSSTITAPDCSKNYFFAVRAFDAADNASGVIGDIEIVTVDEFGRIVLASIAPGLVSSTGAVGGAGTGGEVQGTSASPSVSPSTSESVSPSPSGEVKGEETKEAGISKYKFLYWLIPLVVIVAILFLWWWRRRRGSEDDEDFDEEI